MADERNLTIEAIVAGIGGAEVSIGRSREERRREEGLANISIDGYVTHGHGCGGDICNKGRHIFLEVHW